MRRVLYLFVIVCLVVCSCKNRSSQTPSPSAPAETPAIAPAETPATIPAETLPGMSSTIKAFYQAYCTNWDGKSKTDSILSEYCTEELKDAILEDASFSSSTSSS